jgi:hypothetical protein
MISNSLNITKPTHIGQELSYKNKETKADESSKSTKEGELSEAEKKQVEELKKIDQRVKAHEQAHLAMAAGLSHSGATFSYKRGPDGKRYATGGEVNIDISTVDGDPQATIRKMQQVRRAALAPADPSGQDRSVAAKASREIAKARAELSKQTQSPTAGHLLSAYSPSSSESTFSQIV